MKSLGFLLLIAGLAMTALPADAQTGGKTSFVLKGYTENGQNWWTEGDGTTKNPTLEVPPNTEITLTVSAVSGTHTIQVGSAAVSAVFQAGDEPITYKFTSPASGNVQYVCTIHTGDMKGNFHVAGSPTEEPKKSPGAQVVGVLVALAGVALVVSRRRA